LTSKPTRAPPDDQFQVAGRSAYASKLGLASSDPSKTSADDAAHLMNYVRTQQPEVLKKAVQEKPWFVEAMANPVIMGALVFWLPEHYSCERCECGARTASSGS